MILIKLSIQSRWQTVRYSDLFLPTLIRAVAAMATESMATVMATEKAVRKRNNMICLSADQYCK